MTSSSTPKSATAIDDEKLAAVPSLLPHAPPFRLIDRVVSADSASGTLVAKRRITAACALWPAESFPAALHGDVLPLFPDVLVIEALCQAAACLNILEAAPDAARRHLGYLVAVSQVRFPADFTAPHFGRATVGDTLILQVERQSRMGNLVAFSATARVAARDGVKETQPREVASAQLLFAIA